MNLVCEMVLLLCMDTRILQIKSYCKYECEEYSNNTHMTLAVNRLNVKRSAIVNLFLPCSRHCLGEQIIM